MKEKRLTLPTNWKQIRKIKKGSVFYNGAGLYVYYEVLVLNNVIWDHLKVGRKKRYPSFEDIQKVRNIFLGAEKLAMITVPPQGKDNTKDIHIWYSKDNSMLEWKDNENNSD